MKKLHILTIAMCMMNLIFVNAQNVIPSSGGNIIGSGGNVSYSVGQIVHTTNSGINGSSAQGIQQPYEISVVSVIEETKGISLDCLVYPNPAKEMITLEINNYKADNLSFQLYNISGAILENRKIKSKETTIQMKEFIPSTYFLKVMEENNEIKIFKIIKN